MAELEVGGRIEGFDLLTDFRWPVRLRTEVRAIGSAVLRLASEPANER